jgi:hypothetical protein
VALKLRHLDPTAPPISLTKHPPNPSANRHTASLIEKREEFTPSEARIFEKLCQPIFSRTVRRRNILCRQRRVAVLRDSWDAWLK